MMAWKSCSWLRRSSILDVQLQFENIVARDDDDAWGPLVVEWRSA